MKTCQILGECNPNEDQINRINKLMEPLHYGDEFKGYEGKLKALSDSNRLKK